MGVHIQDITRLWNKALKPVDHPFLIQLCNDYSEHTSACFHHYRFLYHLVKEKAPKFALEIGVEYGLASAHMACAMSEVNKYGRVIGVDINYHHVPGELIPQEFGNYTFIVGDSVVSYKQIEKIVLEKGLIGVVFQDSSHHYYESCREWEMYNRLLDRDNSIWVCDDVHPSFKTLEDPKSMLEYFYERPGVKQLIPYPCGGNNVGIIIQ